MPTPPLAPTAAAWDDKGTSFELDDTSWKIEEIVDFDDITADIPRNTESGMQLHGDLSDWLDALDFSPPMSGPLAPMAPLVHHAYHHEDSRARFPSPPRSHSVVAELMASVLEECRQEREGMDGTVAPEPKSPPVLGRSCEIERGDSGTAALFGGQIIGSNSRAGTIMPKLKRAEVAPKGPWPSSECPGPGLKAEAVEKRSSGSVSVFAFARSHFADIDLDNNRQVSEEELIKFITRRTKQRNSGQVPAELEHLLEATARRCYRQAAVRPQGIRVEDWVHFGLLLTSAPSHLAHHLLNQRLRRELMHSPNLLRKVLHAFEEADARGAGILRPKDLEDTLVDGGKLVEEICFENHRQVTYFDFASFFLGYRRTEVVLNWYDVSQGLAQWVPAAVLGGHRFEGVWHTGVVAFDREYWYGGKVLSSHPGKAPFPPGPVRTTTLGWTLRTREELEDFLRFELAPRYTRDKYDILRRNCNHFSDEVAAFLIQGGHIPDEARSQPEAVMNSQWFLGAQSYMNRWLGGFEAEGCDTEIDDLMTEWRARLWPGDLALYVPQGELYEPPRLVQVSDVDSWNSACNITYFEPDGACWGRAPHSSSTVDVDLRVVRLGSCVHSASFWDWRIEQRKEVPLASLRPHTINGKGLAGSNGAGLGFIMRAPRAKIQSPELVRHLRRKAVVYAMCPQGHAMRPSETCQRRTWEKLVVATHPSCGICKKSIAKQEQYMMCLPCGYRLCNVCDRRGLFKGYYSLGCVDDETAGFLLEDTAWVQYKAQRYMSAAGAHDGVLGSDVWQQKVALRVYGDLGLDLPNTGDLIGIFRRFSGPRRHGRWAGIGDLTEEGFCSMLIELLSEKGAMVRL